MLRFNHRLCSATEWQLICVQLHSPSCVFQPFKLATAALQLTSCSAIATAVCRLVAAASGCSRMRPPDPHPHSGDCQAARLQKPGEAGRLMLSSMDVLIIQQHLPFSSIAVSII
jgi:hypothetical protein